MKKLGLVGGMGPESTIPYYHDIVYGVQEAMGKSIFPELSIESVNVFNVLKLCDEKKYDELTEYLMRAINNLVKSGAEFAALSANTPHIVFDRLKEQSPIPLISIVETTCEEAKHRELKKIGLLGTIFTMTEEFFTVNIPLKYTNGDTSVVIADVINGIVPCLLPLLFTGFIYWLVTKKKMKTTWALILIFIIGILGSLTGILGV